MKLRKRTRERMTEIKRKYYVPKMLHERKKELGKEMRRTSAGKTCV
jgi:hypothetical protein